jgi:hypothetical protein
MLNIRRKKTEPGSKITSRNTFNYYRSAPKSTKSPFQKKKTTPQPRRTFSQILWWLVIFMGSAVILYSLVLHAEPKLAINSAIYRPDETYKQAVAAELNRFVNRTKLTFDDHQLQARLQSQFPEISGVTVSLPLIGQAPTVKLNIAQPSLILKTGSTTPGLAEQLIVDTSGTVIGPQSDFPKVKNLPLISVNSDVGAKTGETILSASEVGFIQTLITQAKQAKVPIASVSLPTSAPEIDLRTADRSYFVKFYLGGDALTQTGQFLAARQQFDQTSKQPQQYLDVRVNGKVFYK